MKKYYLFLFLLFSAVFTFAAPDPYAHLETYDITDKTFFRKLIEGEKITYAICIGKNEYDKNVIKEDLAKRIFLRSISNWKSWTTYYIKTKGEKDKFSDILEIINQKDNFEQKPCPVIENTNDEEKIDLNIIFANENSNESVLGNHREGEIRIYVKSNLNDSKKMIETMTHEIGHLFGLADQYSGATYKGSFLYNSKIKRPSIMDGSGYITCDDADGFITVIDRILNKEREFYSLCSDGIFIKNGKASVKKNSTYKFKENYDYFDAEIQISYVNDFPDYYLFDATLNNFIISKKGIDLLRLMGFEVNDDNNLVITEVKIHGVIHEEITVRENTVYLKTPIGLWTSVLYIKNFDNLEPKQTLVTDFTIEEDSTTLTNLETNKSESVYKPYIPLLDFFPNTGSGIKEEIRDQHTKRILKNDLRNKLISDLDTKLNSN